MDDTFVLFLRSHNRFHLVLITCAVYSTYITQLYAQLLKTLCVADMRVLAFKLFVCNDSLCV